MHYDDHGNLIFALGFGNDDGDVLGAYERSETVDDDEDDEDSEDDGDEDIGGEGGED